MTKCSSCGELNAPYRTFCKKCDETLDNPDLSFRYKTLEPKPETEPVDISEPYGDALIVKAFDYEPLVDIAKWQKWLTWGGIVGGITLIPAAILCLVSMRFAWTNADMLAQMHPKRSRILKVLLWAMPVMHFMCHPRTLRREDGGWFLWFVVMTGLMLARDWIVARRLWSRVFKQQAAVLFAYWFVLSLFPMYADMAKGRSRERGAPAAMSERPINRDKPKSIDTDRQKSPASK